MATPTAAVNGGVRFNNKSNEPPSMATPTSTLTYDPPRFLFDDDDAYNAGGGGDFYDGDDNASQATADVVGAGGLPSESQLVLLCLDHLRDLRRSYPNADDLRAAEGLDADCLSVAIYALSRSFVRPFQLTSADPTSRPRRSPSSSVGTGGEEEASETKSGSSRAAGGDDDDDVDDDAVPYNPAGNDPWLDPEDAHFVGPGWNHKGGAMSSDDAKAISARLGIPSLDRINQEILHTDHLRGGGGPRLNGEVAGRGADYENDRAPEASSSLYKYDDQHVSNSHRFYPLNGLASGPTMRGPLTLSDLAAAGLTTLGARSRLDAEREMVKSPLFEQFVTAVRAKGFFRDAELPVTPDDNDGSVGSSEKMKKKKAAATAKAEYEDRYRKVVAKFRTKLAAKAEQQRTAHQMSPTSGGASVSSGMSGAGSAPYQQQLLLAAAASDRLQRRRARRTEGARAKQQQQQRKRHPQTGEAAVKEVGQRGGGGHRGEEPPFPPPPPASWSSSAAQTPPRRRGSAEAGGGESAVGSVGGSPSTYKSGSSSLGGPSSAQTPVVANMTAPPLSSPPMSPSSRGSRASGGTPHNQVDLDEAERLKATGNAHMQKKEYQEAADAYTAALKLCPAGPQSHVYFSNRAAALLSLKRFHDAILDSERSLALKPDYGKAHSRLGLGHFFLGHYRQAVEAYTISLRYEPNNKASLGYLEKAKKRLAQQQQQLNAAGAGSASTRSGRSATGAGLTDQGSAGEGASSSDGLDSLRRQQNRDAARAAKGAGGDVASSVATSDEEEARQRLIDQREADKLKVQGNTHMASREYQNAINAYSAALQLSPTGPNSHVYFSNRAAALCYLERYEEAELDSERSLALKPDYGKAHARLGLSRFFLGDYEGAIEAYTAALKQDPNNAASKSYLAKAQTKLAEFGNGSEHSDRGETASGVNESAGDGDMTEKSLADASYMTGSIADASYMTGSTADDGTGASMIGEVSEASAMSKSPGRKKGGKSPRRKKKVSIEEFIEEMERVTEEAKGVGGDGAAAASLTSLMGKPAMMRMAENIVKDPKLQERVNREMLDPSMFKAMMEAMGGEHLVKDSS